MSESAQKTVFTQGVFDLMHSNHIRALQTARAFGDRLVVGVSSDRIVETYKRRPVLSQDERLAQVQALACVDEAFIDDAPLTADGLEGLLVQLDPAHYVYFGEGWDEMFAPAQARGILRRMAYHSGISTSGILNTIRSRFAEGSL